MGSDSASVDELESLARAADDADFFYVAVCDHVAIPRALAHGDGNHLVRHLDDPRLSRRRHRRVRLMSHVSVLPYRHPLMTAKAVMTLDTLSKGRAILGVGAGHAADEFAALRVSTSRNGARCSTRPSTL